MFGALPFGSRLNNADTSLAVSLVTMSGMARDRYLEPYRQSAARHGSTFPATLWANEAAQQKRFDIFTQMCFLSGKRIMDAGCSRGDFAHYLIETGVEFADYVGVDGVEQVIEFASSQGLARCRFIAGDFLTDPALLGTGEPDVVCISGSLNTMTDKQVTAALEAAWSAAGQTLLFNFLPDLAGPRAVHQTGPARRLDALRLIRWATGKTGYVQYRQDYFDHGHDATIMMRKQ
jgi:SAM-dependent methyltransferase